jgi:hypothetical protein
LDCYLNHATHVYCGCTSDDATTPNPNPIEVSHDIAEDAAHLRAEQQQNSDDHNGDQDQNEGVFYQALSLFALQEFFNHVRSGYRRQSEMTAVPVPFSSELKLPAPLLAGGQDSISSGIGRSAPPAEQGPLAGLALRLAGVEFERKTDLLEEVATKINEKN